MDLYEYQFVAPTGDDSVDAALNLVISIVEELGAGKALQSSLQEALERLKAATLSSNIAEEKKQKINEVIEKASSIRPPDRGTSGSTGGRPLKGLQQAEGKDNDLS